MDATVVRAAGGAPRRRTLWSTEKAALDAAQKKDLELSSREDADKLERFEAWKKENEKLDYDEDVVNPVPISEDGRIMTPEQAEEEAKEARRRAIQARMDKYVSLAVESCIKHVSFILIHERYRK